MQIHEPAPAPAAEPVCTPVPFVDTAEDAASIPAIIARAFDRLDISERARMLGRLLASVGPLGLAVVGGGAFAKYVTHSRLPEVPVSDEDAAHATTSQLSDLVRYVQQSDPQLLSCLLALIGCDPADSEGSASKWMMSAQPSC